MADQGEKRRRVSSSSSSGSSSDSGSSGSSSSDSGSDSDSSRSRRSDDKPAPGPLPPVDEDDDVIGPMPVLAGRAKKKKVLQYEKLYLDNLPSSEAYERSFMHRDIVTHVVMTRTDFLITASADGHVKFWKKEEEGVEFVKHFRAHLGAVTDVSISGDGLLFASAADDKTLKVFDVVNFDMINMISLNYVPGCCCWIYAHGQAIPAIAIAEKDSPAVHIYDGHSAAAEMHCLAKLHMSPCTFIAYNSKYDTIVSGDGIGMIEYWTGPDQQYKFPENVEFDSKMDTDLYEFAKKKTIPYSISFSPNGELFAALSADRMVRVFRFATGKLYRVFDETLHMYGELQQANPVLPSMDYGRRIAMERELEKAGLLHLVRCAFDESNSFLIYPCVLGIKVVNLVTNKCARIIGKQENIRSLFMTLYQGAPTKAKAALTLEMRASDNPMLLQQSTDPTIVCTAFKKNRFYLFTRREPEETKGAENERDVFNEKPSREEQLAATQGGGEKRLSEQAVLHTTAGDIFIKLFSQECPKAVENFTVHSLNGYFNGHLFHRVIKAFMIQTGDPTATGSGGESIWGGEFEDEFNPKLRHDRPYTVSMANAGPHTNGSQFFITVVPTPWLDNKHTVFGRVTRGMEAVQSISQAKTHPKTDRPYEDIKIVSVTIK